MEKFFCGEISLLHFSLCIEGYWVKVIKMNLVYLQKGRISNENEKGGSSFSNCSHFEWFWRNYANRNWYSFCWDDS